MARLAGLSGGRCSAQGRRPIPHRLFGLGGTAWALVDSEFLSPGPWPGNFQTIFLPEGMEYLPGMGIQSDIRDDQTDGVPPARVCGPPT